MKKLILLLIVFVISGCSVFVSRSLHEIVQTVDEFTLTNITSENDAASAGKFISGSAPIFIEFGADSCLVAKFNRNREMYTVEVVSFLKPKGALGAYSITELYGSSDVELGLRARKSDTILQFVKGRYIVSVFTSKASSMTGCTEIASGLAKRIPAGAFPPDIYERLPKFKMIEQSGLYFMGSKAFQERFSSELAEVFILDRMIEGLAAQYRTDDGIVYFIKIRYPRAEHALDAVNSYLKSRLDRPVILPSEVLNFYTVVARDRTEVYLAGYADWLYVMFNGPPGGKGGELFEYIMRGGK
ncbi:MAG: hypothetical protein HOC71_04785 [Candidatus Latescibacteria bacterium]|nr:hypothetical protein [Candidatus Latescibacterota bacterium]